MKNVLISGVNGGMGIATAKEFKEKGYNVIGLDIQDKASVEGIRYFQCDITDEVRINNIYKDIAEEIDCLSALISLAGIYVMDSLLEIPNETLKKVLDINSLGAYRLVKAFYPLLKAKSKVILISSEVGPLDPLPFNGIYGISKSLLEKYAFSLRMELNIFDIDVVVFRPGAVKTNLLNDSVSELDKMCAKTTIHKETSTKFKKIVASIESKYATTDKIAKKIWKIENKKHPRYVYKLNNNPLLKILNSLPDRMQVKIIGRILKSK